MRLWDTPRGEAVPLDLGPVVRMYSCGITPYDAAHLGHASVYLAFDLLQRRLRDLGHETRCVRNVTDVDDDILRKARELGVHYLDLAAEEMARFDSDMKALNLLPVWSEPRATSAISDILSLVGRALDQGYAYRSGGAVYFDVSKFPEFGKISHYDRETMLVLAAQSTAGNPMIPSRTILWTSSSGSPLSPTNRPGTRDGARGDRDGMSNAPPSCCGSWGRRSTYTEAGAT